MKFASWIVAALALATPALARRKNKGGPNYSRFPDRDDPFGRAESAPHRLEKPYLDRDMSNRYYEFGGNTFVRNDKFVRLTADAPDQRGWIMSNVPSIPDSFQLEFVFSIHGQGASLFGDGMAVWFLNERVLHEGSVFGLPDQFTGTGIFFDTYKNGSPGKVFPYVTMMQGDGRTMYDKDHDGAANEIVGCSARGLHNAKGESKARITYVKGKFLSIELDYRGMDRWDLCSLVSQHDDQAVDLGQPLYLGFSAQTGELSENHDLYSARLYALTNPPDSFSEVDYYMNGNLDALSKTETKNVSNVSSQWSTGGWFWFFFKLFTIAAICGAIYVLVAMLRGKKRNTRRNDTTALYY